MSKQNKILLAVVLLLVVAAGAAYQIHSKRQTAQAQQYLAEATQLIAADQYDKAFNLAQQAAVLRPHEAQNILAQLSTLRRSQQNFIAAQKHEQEGQLAEALEKYQLVEAKDTPRFAAAQQKIKPLQQAILIQQLMQTPADEDVYQLALEAEGLLPLPEAARKKAVESTYRLALETKKIDLDQAIVYFEQVMIWEPKHPAVKNQLARTRQQKEKADFIQNAIDTGEYEKLILRYFDNKMDDDDTFMSFFESRQRENAKYDATISINGFKWVSEPLYDNPRKIKVEYQAYPTPITLRWFWIIDLDNRTITLSDSNQGNFALKSAKY